MTRLNKPYSLEMRARAGSAQGRAAKQSGDDFQTQIKQAAEWYTLRRYASLIEVPVATFGAPGHRKFAAKQSIDFAGAFCLHDRTYPIVFDAKVTTGDATLSLSFDDARERQRTARQVQTLLDFHNLGHTLAGYLCLDRAVGEHGAIFWLDAPALAPLTTPRFLAGETPRIEIRRKARPARGVERIDTDLPWRMLTPDRDVVAGRAPRVDWRALACAVIGWTVDP